MAQGTPVDFASVRENNLSLVTNLIREAGSISRADLVRNTNLSATTVSSLATQLLSSGYIFESTKGASSGGRPPVMLEFDFKFRHVIGVDMGSTHLSLVAMDLKSEVAASRRCAFDVINDPQGTTQKIIELLRSILDELQLPIHRILGIGIGVPSPIEGEKLDRLSPIILPKWSGFDLIGQLQSVFPLPIYMDNDANAGALAIKWWGIGRDCANLAYIKIGTGVGCGLVINHKIYRGTGGAAGEIGHTIVDIDGPLCRCGNRGCLESLVSIPKILARVSSQSVHPGSVSTDTSNQINGIAAESYSQLALESLMARSLAGDPIYIDAIESMGIYLGIAIANLLNLFNPELVVLGGDIFTVGQRLVEPLQRTIKRYAVAKVAHEARISLMPLDSDTVAVGAATLAIQAAFEPENLLCTLQV